MTQVAFYACALVVLAAAIAAALRRDLRDAARALVLAGAALAGLLALVGATAAATVQVVCAGGAALALRRAESVRDGEPAASPPLPLRGALLVAAFLAILLRPLLMTSWPLPAGAQAPVGLSHYLVVGAALFSVGLFAAAVRRDGAGMWIAVALMNCAAGLCLAAAGSLVAGASAAQSLAAVVILVAAATAAWPMAAADRGGGAAPHREAAQKVGLDLAVATAGVTLALLASGW